MREYASDIRVQRVKANIHVIIYYKRRLWVMSWEKLQYLPSKADPYCFVSLVFNVLIEKKKKQSHRQSIIYLWLCYQKLISGYDSFLKSTKLHQVQCNNNIKIPNCYIKDNEKEFCKVKHDINNMKSICSNQRLYIFHLILLKIESKSFFMSNNILVWPFSWLFKFRNLAADKSLNFPNLAFVFSKFASLSNSKRNIRDYSNSV